jgi:hypothetical protein
MLRRLWIPLSVLILATAWPCLAQDGTLDLRRDEQRSSDVASPNLSGLSPTPEMWFYEQERARYENPKMAVRRKAELRGQQRADRLAALKWYGIDNSRPTVSGTPWFGSYGPYWGSNTFDPLRWRQPTVPVIVSRSSAERY